VRRFILLTAMLTLATTTHAADDKLSLSTGLDYSMGNYGETQDTETWFLPVNLKYKHDRYTFRLGTAYVWVVGPQNVTPEGDPLPGGGTTRTIRGPGDVTTSLAINILGEDKSGLDVDLTGKIKFATADVNKALGTGENDYALQVSLYKTVATWGPYLDLGYRWKGDPAGVNYHNIWYGVVGASYRHSKLWSAGADYSWRDKLTAASEPLSEVTVYANYKINATNRLNLYGLAGFSDASADWGVGFTVSHLL